jgi:hypothetical protein
MTADHPGGRRGIVTAADDTRRDGVQSVGHEDMDGHDDDPRTS